MGIFCLLSTILTLMETLIIGKAGLRISNADAAGLVLPLGEEEGDPVLAAADRPELRNPRSG